MKTIVRSCASKKRGSVLLIVLSVILVLGIAVGFLLRLTSSHLIIARAQLDSEKAVYVSEAGLERAASYIGSGGALPAAFDGAVGDGVYCVTIINGATPAAGNFTVAGSININPNNSPDNEFSVGLPGGGTVTRDMLVDTYDGYVGPALSVHIKPKGNGNQNHLQVDGEPYLLANANAYDISAAAMSVNIYNDKVNPQGKAVGHWWIAIATTESELTVTP